MAWVGWLDAKTRQVIQVVQWGDSTNYLSKILFMRMTGLKARD